MRKFGLLDLARLLCCAEGLLQLVALRTGRSPCLLGYRKSGPLLGNTDFTLSNPGFRTRMFLAPFRETRL